ncbi:MAG: glycosyltransferase family 4 protein [Patescibacteria group bacterium]
MKLLIITQKVDYNDDVLGFMHGWIEEFARQCERVTVICLQAGEYNFPNNVKVLSLGKENPEINPEYSGQKSEIIKKIKYLLEFYRYIWCYRRDYDAVFVHMNPEYVALGGLFWRLGRKKVGLWYAHGHVPVSLKIAEKSANIIFTSTVSGCRVKSAKIRVVGQGIDTGKLKSQKPASSADRSKVKSNDQLKIITVGRISPSKDYETLVLAAEILKNKNLKFEIEIIGGPATESDKNYFAELRYLVVDKKLNDEIKFIGPVANREIAGYLQTADLFVNMGQTGSLDKAIVEAMSCELPVLSCNEAMLEILGGYQDLLMYPKQDYKRLAEKIEFINNLSTEQYQELGKNLRSIVIKNHSLNNLVSKILNLYKKI